MKVIIAGGRNYRLTKEDFKIIYDIHDDKTITEIVSGGCKGVDTDGEIWACENLIPVKRFPADWLKHGKAAGPIRNEQMAKYADAVILFPGGKGTANMRKLAVKYGLNILHDFKYPLLTPTQTHAIII